MSVVPKVKLRCPMCKSVTYKQSIEGLLREVEEMWKPWQEYLTVKQRQQIQDMNTKEKLEKILAEKGEITMLCPVCQFTTTQIILDAMKKGEKMPWKTG